MNKKVYVEVLNPNPLCERYHAVWKIVGRASKRALKL